jgi:hypothetical protein
VYQIFSMYIENQKCENLLQLAFSVFLPFRPFSCLFDHVTFPDASIQPRRRRATATKGGRQMEVGSKYVEPADGQENVMLLTHPKTEDRFDYLPWRLLVVTFPPRIRVGRDVMTLVT